MMYFLRQLRATIYAITVLHYVATCSRHIHVTNANNPELKTLTQKLLHLTRYAPTSMLMKLNIVSSTEHVYCTYEFSIVCSFAFSALSLLVGSQKAIQSVKTFASKHLGMLIMWGWGIVWSTLWVIPTCLHRKSFQPDPCCEDTQYKNDWTLRIRSRGGMQPANPVLPRKWPLRRCVCLFLFYTNELWCTLCGIQQLPMFYSFYCS